MHATSFVQLALLALATSSWAITVTQPSQGTTWNAAASNIVTWTEVSTDPTTFAITLVQGGVFKQTLGSNVDGTKGSFTVPSNLPTGTDFQVNIVKSSQDLNTILAQSAQFNITQGGSSSGTGAGSVSAVTVTSSSVAGAATVASVTAATGSLDTALPGSSSIVLNPSATHSNAASLSSPTHGGLMGLLALFGFALV